MRPRPIEKEHKFTAVVKTTMARQYVYHAILTAFAKRDPDGLKFNLMKSPPKKP